MELLGLSYLMRSFLCKLQICRLAAFFSCKVSPHTHHLPSAQIDLTSQHMHCSDIVGLLVCVC